MTTGATDLYLFVVNINRTNRSAQNNSKTESNDLCFHAVQFGPHET